MRRRVGASRMSPLASSTLNRAALTAAASARITESSISSWAASTSFARTIGARAGSAWPTRPSR